MTDDHTAPESTDPSVAGAGDDGVRTSEAVPGNLFDDAPAERAGARPGRDSAAPVDGAAVATDGDLPGPTGAATDPASEAGTAIDDGADDGTPGGPADEADEVDEGEVDDGEVDEGPDWEALAAADPRTGGELLRDLAVAAASRDDYLDSLQRKQAEFENFRRRMQQQSAQQRVAGHADVAGRMLEVLDDFDRTLASIATTADDGVVKGVSLVRDKLTGALREVGLERVDDQGAAFDPNRHEAVQQVPGDGIVEPGGEPVVAEVLRPGYVLGTRVLRVAMVAVAQ